MSKFIIFTDLDGTLLDHHSYSYDEARPGLQLIRDHKAPLVMVSSKTFDEMILLHGELRLSGPFIFENGGGIAWKSEATDGPDPFRLEINGKTARELEELFPVAEDILNFRGIPLSAMSPEEVAENTGLPLERARLARKRRASLPFLIKEESPLQEIDLDKACTLLKKYNLSITRGGRFYHLITLGASKGSAIKMVLDHYTEISHAEPITSVGIGDSENDLSMLKSVGRPFLVRRHDGTHLHSDLPGIVYTDNAGPAGFTEAISSLWI